MKLMVAENGVSEFVVRERRPARLWLAPWNGLLRTPPRLLQLAHVARCAFLGHHDWSAWLTDDYDGPGEYLSDDPDDFMPFTSRVARPNEDASRCCMRCDLVQFRAIVIDPATECLSCVELASEHCPESPKPCGHHCNHSWTHDGCCWCGTVWDEQ